MSDATADAGGDLPTLRFTEAFVEPIRDGAKTVTIRLDLDDRIQVGRRVAFLDEKRDCFATAVVADRGCDRLAAIARTGVEGHKSYDSPAELISQMREFYPDQRVTGDTLAGIVRWDHDGVWE